MAQQDVLQDHFADPDQIAFDAAMLTLETLLQPRLRNLDEAENEKYTTIGEKYKGFVNKVQDYNSTQPALSSPDVDWTEYNKDAFDRRFLETGAAGLMALAGTMIETKRMHDYDNFQNALVDKKFAVYKSDTSPGLGYDAKAAALAEFFIP